MEIVSKYSYISNRKIIGKGIQMFPYSVAHHNAKIGDYCIKYFHENKIGTVIKHIPGHGLAKVDSHNFTPIVNKKQNLLFKKDFVPFKKKKTTHRDVGNAVGNKDGIPEGTKVGISVGFDDG